MFGEVRLKDNLQTFNRIQNISIYLQSTFQLVTIIVNKSTIAHLVQYLNCWSVSHSSQMKQIYVLN